MKGFRFFEAAWAEILEHLLKAPYGGKINSDAAREYIEEYITRWLLFASLGWRLDFRMFRDALQKFRESSQTPIGEFILSSDPHLLTRLMQIDDETNAILKWAEGEDFERDDGRATLLAHRDCLIYFLIGVWEACGGKARASIHGTRKTKAAVRGSAGLPGS